MSVMAALPSCSCCAYAAIKQLVNARMNDYESIMSKFKAAERQLDKVDSQINVIKEDVERKTLTAAKSPMVRGGKEQELAELSQEFSNLEDAYGDMHMELGCPCCRGMSNAKIAATEMMEAADLLRTIGEKPIGLQGLHDVAVVAFHARRESFTEGPNLSPMPHSVLSRRREVFEEKADEACELRRQGVARLQFYTGEAKEFLGSFQSLQDQFNGMMESISMHNALMLLGEEGSSSTAKQGKREGKRVKAGAASTGNKSRKTAVHKKGAEHSRSAKAKDQSSAAAVMSESDGDTLSIEDAAVESAVTHSNPFAALHGQEDGVATEAVAEPASSDSSSARSTSTSADVALHVNGKASQRSPKPRRHSHENIEPDLAAQRQAVLAQIRGSNAGPLQLANGISHVTLEAPRSNGRATAGQLGNGQTEAGELGTAEQLRAQLGDSLLASELVGHLCCPITEELIQDPVVAMDGFTYERSAILDWFMERPAGFSYLTKQRLPSKVLLPNKDYRSLMVQLIG